MSGQGIVSIFFFSDYAALPITITSKSTVHKLNEAKSEP